jgi:Ti-type conjugative transfer relaxase TraA
VALAHTRMKVLGRSGGNTVGRIAYRSGVDLVCEETGQCFHYAHKSVQRVELLLPKDAPSWAFDLQKRIEEDRTEGVAQFVHLAESHESRVDAQVYREYEFALPRELTADQGMDLAREFVQDQMCGRGMASLLNFHLDVDKETQEPKYHCHAVMVTRRLTEQGLSLLKERSWNDRALGQEWRQQFAAYTNFHLAKHGHTVRIDPRSYEAQGMTIEPQPKLGPGTLKREYEKGADPKDVTSKTVTDKGTEYQRIKLRNLYKLLSHPEEIFKLVTAHHVTFMWGDVQKHLRRYVEDPRIAENLESRLKASPELVVLGHMPMKHSEIDLSEKIYTTKTMLAHELSLVEKAQALEARSSHPVRDHIQTKAISSLDEKLSAKGGLSEDQRKALGHILGPQQLACVIGYAGSGKTTILQAATKAWESEGYQVYGLAPTGKAAENLRSVGIDSQVIHKFLGQYDRGRCQYNSQSVLILDEAGMVDVPHFDRLLRATQALGIKLVMVGDGQQLQPVEAGDAFALVSKALKVTTLETVVRQIHAWQRHATQLFGRQDSVSAIQLYKDHGAFTFVEEPLMDEERLPYAPTQELLRAYAQAKRVKSTLYHHMRQDTAHHDAPHHDATHQDAPLYEFWQTRFLVCKKEIERRGIIPEEVQTSPEVREGAKKALIAAWGQSIKNNPQDSHVILTYTQKDSFDLNQQARTFMKESGLLKGPDHVFTTHRESRTAFGESTITRHEQAFALGDRLLFLKNKGEIKNGMLGTITEIKKGAITLKVDGRREPFTFNPHLYRTFDYGYAPTIHKSQGITVDRAFVLGTHHMFKNLAYVALTRHRKDVKIFGSRLDFWRDEVISVMAKNHHKLSSFDYVSKDQAQALEASREPILEKALRRLGERAEAVKAVGKEAWSRMSETFLGRNPRAPYGELPVTVTEDVRGKILTEREPTPQKIPGKAPEKLSSAPLEDKDLLALYGQWRETYLKRAPLTKLSSAQIKDAMAQDKVAKSWAYTISLNPELMEKAKALGLDKKIATHALEWEKGLQKDRGAKDREREK